MAILTICGFAMVANAETQTSDRPSAILVYPYVRTISMQSTDTSLALTNTSTTAVAVRCYVEDATGTCSGTSAPCADDSDCGGADCVNAYAVSQFHIVLAAGQPIAWDASAGLAALPLPENQGQIPPVPGDFFGTLRCVAETAAGNPGIANVLVGQATLSRPGVSIASYAAVGFEGLSQSADEMLSLGGVNQEYAGCPNTVQLQHLYEGTADPVTGDAIHTLIAIAPCSLVVPSQTPISTSLTFLLPSALVQDPIVVGPIEIAGPTSLPLRLLGNQFDFAQRGTEGGLTRIASSRGIVAVSIEYHERPTPDPDTFAARNVSSAGVRPQADVMALAGPTPTPTPHLVILPTEVTAALSGGIACVPVRLVDSSMPLATENSFLIPNLRLYAAGAAINPAIGPESAVGKDVSGQFTVSGMNQVPIPDGLLYTATFQIYGDTPLGTYPLIGPPHANVKVTACGGDCDGDGIISIGEVQKTVNLLLGQPLCNPIDPAKSCPDADKNGDGTVSIGELQQAVNRFLSNC